MFTSLSMTGTGMLVALAMMLLRHFNINDIDENTVTSVISALGVILGFIWMIWGHIRARPDLTLGLIRKQ